MKTSVFGKYITAIVVIFSFFIQAFTQDIDYARNIINILASDTLKGRGYQYDADKRSAIFVREEFKKHGLLPIGDSYFQPFIFPVNSIIGETYCSVNGKELEAGVEYYISARSKGAEKTFELKWLGYKTAKKSRRMRKFYRADLSNTIIVVDPEISRDPNLNELYQSLFRNNWSGKERQTLNPAGMIRLMDKPAWHVSDSGVETDYIVLSMRTGTVTEESDSISLRFTNHFEKHYESNNVIAMVPGQIHPDSFIVFTAHYDHLGMMGEVMIPGANDNASGTAMILDLARHYSENPPNYSVAFFAFTAEEAGLLGSKYYVQNPKFPLENIKLLINLDMVGTGSNGITLVNGSVFKDDFAILDSLNNVYSLLPQVRARGTSSNSDHYHFYANGVKAFFIYTMGSEFREYHNIYDRPEKLPLTKYEELFKLLVKFANHYM